MEQFLPSRFFDLSHFEFKAIFNEKEPVWKVLDRIGEYLLSGPLGKIEGIVEPGAYLVNPEEISIGKGSIVEPGAYILGPCIIGENCQVRQGAYIRGNFIAGNECVIGHTTEVKNTIFLNHVQAGHFAYVGDSILGNHVNLGAGTKCANLRFDRKNVMISHHSHKLDTGRHKLGAIMGDFSQTGCNAVTNPGTIMGKRSCVPPCVSAKGVIPENHYLSSPENYLYPIH